MCIAVRQNFHFEVAEEDGSGSPLGAETEINFIPVCRNGKFKRIVLPVVGSSDGIVLRIECFAGSADGHHEFSAGSGVADGFQIHGFDIDGDFDVFPLKRFRGDSADHAPECAVCRFVRGDLYSCSGNGFCLCSGCDPPPLEGIFPVQGIKVMGISVCCRHEACQT